MNRNPIYLGIIIILLIAGYFMLRADKRIQAPAPEVAVTPAPSERTFAWRFTTTEESADGLPPRTDVALITNDETYDFGGFPGSCAEIAPENLLPGEVEGILCWWAGAGDEIGVFLEEGRYIVRRGFQEEPTAETEGYRGSFNDLVVLE
jgi:hypothetical protein